MKKVFLLLPFLMATSAFAEQDKILEIVCHKPPYAVEFGSDPSGKGSLFVLRKNNEIVGRGELVLTAEGYDDSFLNAYVWAFESPSADSGVSVGVKSLKQPSFGVYEGLADLFVTANGHSVTGSSVPCEVFIK